MEPKIEFGQAKFFTPRWKLKYFIFAVLTGLGVFALLLLFIALEQLFHIVKSHPDLMLVIFLFLNVLYCFTAIYFWPRWGGTVSICRHFAAPEEGFVAAVSYVPRRNRGWQAAALDTDDVGVFKIDDGDIVFQGDLSSFTIPKNIISEVVFKQPDIWRYLGLLGRQAEFHFKEPLSGITVIKARAEMGKNYFELRRANRDFREYVGKHMGKGS